MCMSLLDEEMTIWVVLGFFCVFIVCCVLCRFTWRINSLIMNVRSAKKTTWGRGVDKKIAILDEHLTIGSMTA